MIQSNRGNGQTVDFCDWKRPPIDLDGKIMGLIGFGSIGQAVAHIANAFGMKVAVYTLRPKVGMDKSELSFVSLDELFGNSDVISLHCPLNIQTEHIINLESLAMMKRSAFLINTGRGGLVNEQDLADALDEDQLAGADVDVVSQVPIHSDNPLLNAKNCIITPHIDWASFESRQRLMKITVENLAAYLMGTPQHVVKA